MSVVIVLVVLAAAPRARDPHFIAPGQVTQAEHDAGLIAVTSRSALALYRGCVAGPSPRREVCKHHVCNMLPHLLVAGVQKGGTSTLMHRFRVNATALRTCTSVREAHFFDQPRWQHAMVHADALRQYTHARLSHCRSARARMLVRIEKTPAYLDNPWTPRRVCEAYASAGRPVFVVIMLREPVARAYSAYGMFRELILPELGMNASAVVADGFDVVARVDMAIARACDEPPAASYHQPRASAAAQRLRRCCEVAACEAHPPLCGRTGWRGCRMETHMALQFLPVRRGMYARFLPGWLRYHRAASIRLVDFSRCVGRDALACAEAIAAWVRREQMGARADGAAIADADANVTAVRLQHQAPEAPMANHTRTALREFYAPHNDALFALLGVEPLAGWSTVIGSAGLDATRRDAGPR